MIPFLKMTVFCMAFVAAPFAVLLATCLPHGLILALVTFGLVVAALIKILEWTTSP